MSGSCWNGHHILRIEIQFKIFGNFEAPFTKTDSFLGKFEEKVSEIWNEIDPDVIRFLYENYENFLL